MIKQIVNAETGNVELIQMTAEEEQAHSESVLAAQAAIDDQIAAEQAEIATRASARAKLAALGLTEEEVAALIK